MHWIPKTSYYVIRGFVKAYLRLFLEFKVWGKEHLAGVPKIYCANHFSSTDPFFVITLMKEPIHMIVGPGFNVPVFRHILKHGEQISALPEDRKFVIPKAVDFLKKGESIFIFPEGDLNDQKTITKFYSGFAKIYMEYPVEIVPIGILSPIRYVKEKEVNIKVRETTHKTLTVLTGKYYANIGKPMRFPDLEKCLDKDYAIEQITDRVKNEIERLIMDIKLNKFWS